MRECLPAEGESAFPRRFDILVIDEAHNVAPSGQGQYALDSLRTQTVRFLTPHFEHKLFLTATPHNGYRESFTALLELLDSQRFAVELEPDEKQLRAGRDAAVPEARTRPVEGPVHDRGTSDSLPSS
jgi:hypothetical protein